MEDKKLLIVGIDPGTTTAYSILDIGGNIIKLESSKNMGINSLIHNITKEGNVILVGTDKAKVPSVVYSFAAKVGAKLIYPKEDLKVNEKKSLTEMFEAKDEHQSDALAASLFAFNSIKNALNRADLLLNKVKKTKIKNEVLELMILDGVSLRNAIDIIEKPEKEEVKIVKNAIREKKPEKNDFIRIYNKLKAYEREILFLKKHNANLKNSLKDAEKRYDYLSSKINNFKFDQEAERLISHKEKRMLSFYRELKIKSNEVGLLKDDIKKLNYFLANISSFYLLKKLRNLGSLEFSQKGSLLNIGKGDMLLVEDMSIISQNVAERLKDPVTAIIYKNDISGKIKKKLPFIFINYKNLSVLEAEHFAIAKKEHLDLEISKVNLLDKVVSEYKRENP